MHSRFLSALLLTVILVVMDHPAEAQPPAGLPVTGVVVDPTGGVLPDARVELRSAAGVTVVSTATNRTGAFRIDSVPPGRYEVLVTFPGFKPTGLRVTVGTRAPGALRVTMPLAAITQEVTVGRAASEINADTASNLDVATVDQETIANLPILDQDVLGTMARFLDASAIGESGTTLIVNGLEVNSLSVSASAIEQIKINQDPYSAEFARPGRGRIEVITKPGSQEYHGAANLFFRDSTLDARNAFAATRPPEQRRTVEGFVGGPVKQSAATFFALSLRDDADDRQAIVVAQDPAGPIRQNVATPARNVLATGTITHQHSEKTTIAVGLSYRKEAVDNQGVGGFTLQSAAANWNQIEQEATYTQQTVLTATLLHQFRLLLANEWETQTSISQAPSVVVRDAFTGGGAQGNAYRTEHHFTLTDSLTWSPGRHVIKTGLNIPDWSRRRYDDNMNSGGTFYFSGLADYVAGRPFSFIQQVGNGHVA